MWWEKIKARFSPKKILLLGYLIAVGILAIFMYGLQSSKLYQSSLLYIFVPYVISLVITVLRSPDPPKSATQRFISHIFTSFAILVSLAILLGEGFVCLVLFLPIYFIVVVITYLSSLFRERADKKNKKMHSIVVPFLVVIASLEGTSNFLSFSRSETVTLQHTTPISIEQVHLNLAKSFDLNKERHWLIALFPMPYHIEAGSLQEGDVHTIYTRYHRWFYTNTHEGKSELLIEKVAHNRIATRVLSDTTYFSHYLQWLGTDIFLEKTSDGRTEITLEIHYERKLDPAWYFAPLQRFAMSHLGDMVIQELMIRQ